MEKYLSDGNLSEDEIRDIIRKATINSDFVPVLCGSALKIKEFSLCLTLFWIICRHR